MKNKIIYIAIFLILTKNVFAKEEYPNFSGQILLETRFDRLLDSEKKDIESNSGFVNIEPDFSLNLNKNWSVKTGLRILPIRQRQYDYPERSRNILGVKEGINRGFNQDDTGLVVEELKFVFENEDLKFSAGKYNPTFATLYRRNKRIGLFITDFTEDYELREKIGANISALFDKSEITLNGFFADTTGLSDSAGFERRKKQSRNDNLSSNDGTISSYSLTIEGQDLFAVKDLFYNFGYRELDVEETSEFYAKEKGYTMNLEYIYKINRNASLIPIIEIVKLKNFTGVKNRDAKYITTSLVAKYSGWNLSLTNINRDIDNNLFAEQEKNRDKILQLAIGYKFKNNIAIDVSRANIKEDGYKANAIGFIASYLYEF